MAKDSTDAAVVGQRLYILDAAGGRLHTIDITDPAAPRHLGVRGLAGDERFLAGDGARLATTGACQDGFRRCWDSTADTLRVYSTRDDTGPAPAGAFHSFNPEDVAIVGTRAYAAASDGRLQVLDLADPARPRQIGATGPHGARHVRAAGDRWAFVTTSNAGEWPMTRLWRVDLSRPDDPGTPVLNALDLGAVNLDLLAADESHLLVAVQRRRAGPPNDPFYVATDVLAYRVAADGGIQELAQLEGGHNALGAALWNDQAMVLSDRYYPPPPDFDPQRGGGYSTTCTGNDLLTYQLGPLAAGSATTAVEVSCSSNQLHLDSVGQRLYLYSDHGENLQVLDLTAPGAAGSDQRLHRQPRAPETFRTASATSTPWAMWASPSVGMAGRGSWISATSAARRWWPRSPTRGAPTSERSTTGTRLYSVVAQDSMPSRPGEDGRRGEREARRRSSCRCPGGRPLPHDGIGPTMS